VRTRWLAPFVLMGVLAIAGSPPRAQTPAATSGSGRPSDIELVEKLLVARRDYQKALENLRTHYLQGNDLERAKWAEEELLQYHRVPKQAYRLELDVPPPNLSGLSNVPDANKLFTRAMKYKDQGWGTDYIDNQRRAELLFQELLTRYPASDKISDAAYMLGEIYENKPYKQYRRAAQYFERCYQWNPRTQFDARIRAARIYDRQLAERPRAMELYREVTTHEIDPKRIQEATKRLADLSGGR
jgi:TolA-binding protein